MSFKTKIFIPIFVLVLLNTSPYISKTTYAHEGDHSDWEDSAIFIDGDTCIPVCDITCIALQGSIGVTYCPPDHYDATLLVQPGEDICPLNCLDGCGPGNNMCAGGVDPNYEVDYDVCDNSWCSSWCPSGIVGVCENDYCDCTINDGDGDVCDDVSCSSDCFYDNTTDITMVGSCVFGSCECVPYVQPCDFTQCAAACALNPGPNGENIGICSGPPDEECVCNAGSCDLAECQSFCDTDATGGDGYEGVYKASCNANGTCKCTFVPDNPDDLIISRGGITVKGFDLGEFSSNFFKIALPIAVILGFINIISAGYALMTSEGDPRKVNEGKEQLTAAIMGLLYVLLTIGILRIVLGTLIAGTGVSF